ncbi:AAA family ATPase [Thalassoporum mexicanum]|uniref:AAA family ATPase n=1 Tax=Thalassoporum mexicanum TaxID=3457544 RepID=UPI00059F29C9|nr:AAA family ATPase [Pseudanabaena sp. PCC 7367]
METPDKNAQLSRVVLKGFKSIAECDIELKPLNVLIGCNGAGKSNFISFFKMIQQLLDKNLQRFVGQEGGPDSILHFGRKTTEILEVGLYFGMRQYKAAFMPTKDNRLMIGEEILIAFDNLAGSSKGKFETVMGQTKGTADYYVLSGMKGWWIFHFHDTSDSATVKQLHPINDNIYLRPDASNLAAFLYLLKEQYRDNYDRIVKTIRLVAPFFGDFILRPSPLNQDNIQLEWQELGQDIPFKAHHLSDGTLRFICLATLLLQPKSLQPETILIDEPELGLHPYAINVLASLIRLASLEKQLIVSTQSIELLNNFEPEDVIVVDRDQGKSTLNRLSSSKLQEWLDEYTLGELWQKNLFGGTPAR